MDPNCTTQPWWPQWLEERQPVPYETETYVERGFIRDEQGKAAVCAVRALLAIAQGGRIAVARGALACLGAVGRAIALAMEHNYGSTLRGALIEFR